MCQGTYIYHKLFNEEILCNFYVHIDVKIQCRINCSIHPEGSATKLIMAYLCLGCIPGTNSISDMSPVQLFCSGKSTHTSVPFLLMERTTPTLWWVTEPHLYLTEQIHIMYVKYIGLTEA